MIKRHRPRVWRRASLSFPERQIYIRGGGQVHFFTFTAKMQATLAAVGLVFFGWVAFASVNVIFKDRILASKERHLAQMQTAYENRIADLQLSYDELNGALVLAQDRFKAVADSLESKQHALAAVIEHKTNLEHSLRVGASGPEPQPVAIKRLPSSPGGVGGVFDPLSADSALALSPPLAAAVAPIQTQRLPKRDAGAERSPAAAVEHRGFFTGTVGRLGALFHRLGRTENFDHPIMTEAAAQSARIVRLELDEPALLGEVAQDMDKETVRLTRTLASTGLDSKTLIKRIGADREGVKLIDPAESATSEGFTATINDTLTAMGKLDTIVTALNAVPLSPPTEFGSVSSGFGARVDPFNERLAFHSGVDFSGPKGTPVVATGSGIVVFAARRGEYGNTVEVDHGYGIRTRYAHLATIIAQIGSRVDKGAIVGMLGSTGRSTGPHIHYEVWYDDVVRDPSKFIKAGQHVLQE
jgi:murein DD-endopeptidase MepM/ murein hydrolase activator NlpD